MSEIYHINRSLSRDLCEKYRTFSASQNQRGRPAYGRRSRGLFPASLPFVGAALAVSRSCAGAARPGGRALQVSRPKDGRPHGADPTDLIRLASLGTFPQGKACGRPQGSPLRRKADRERWFGRARRGSGTAPAPIFHISRAQWPGGNLERHSDFARRKCSARPKG